MVSTELGIDERMDAHHRFFHREQVGPADATHVSSGGALSDAKNIKIPTVSPMQNSKEVHGLEFRAHNM